MLQELHHNFAPVMQNFKDVADVRDVLGDTYRSFAKGPRRHIVAADYLSLSPEEQLKRVVKQGWLMKDGTINKLVRSPMIASPPNGTHFVAFFFLTLFVAHVQVEAAVGSAH